MTAPPDFTNTASGVFDAIEHADEFGAIATICAISFGQR